MTRSFFKLAFCVSLPLFALPANASTCDPGAPTTVDVQIYYRNESECAKKALDITREYLAEVARAESLSDSQSQCRELDAAVTLLDKYRAGDWRKSYKGAAEDIDERYNEVLGAFLKTTCPQKLALFQHLAAKGETWAMYNLGEAYSKGKGVKQNDRTAIGWYSQAAAGEYAKAYSALGDIYSDGAAFQPDLPTAFEWYLKGAEKGDANAQYIVAGWYRKGTGVTRDLKKAEEWYRKAIGQKHEGAKAKLEEMIKAGEAKKQGGLW